MREIFIEEAREVVTTAREALAVLDRSHHDSEAMTVVRRAFHTLKGSSRMVGLDEFGDAGWACEQLCNSRLADSTPTADAPLRAFFSRAFNEFEAWIERIAQGQIGGVGDKELIAAATALRTGVGLEPAPATKSLLAMATAHMSATPPAPVPVPVAPPVVASVHQPRPSAWGTAARESGAAPRPPQQQRGEPEPEPEPAAPAPAPAPEFAHAVDVGGLAAPGLAHAWQLHQDALALVSAAVAVEAPVAEVHSSAAPAESEHGLAAPGLAHAWQLHQEALALVADAIASAATTAPVHDEPEPEPHHGLAAPGLAHAWQLLQDAVALIDEADEGLAAPGLVLAEQLCRDALAQIESADDVFQAATHEPEEPESGLASPGLGFAWQMHQEALALVGEVLATETELSDDDVAHLAAPGLAFAWQMHQEAEEVVSELLSVAEDLTQMASVADPELDTLAAPGLCHWHQIAAAPAVVTKEERASAEFALDFELLLPADLEQGDATASPELPVADVWDDGSSGDDVLDLVLREIEAAAEAPAPAPAPVPAAPAEVSDEYRTVGHLQISTALFNIYLDEADEQSKRLCTALEEWHHEQAGRVNDTAVALAHSLAGNSGTVGYKELSSLARRLEHALGRSQAREHGMPNEAALYLDVADEIRRMLCEFAVGVLAPVDARILERMEQHEHAEAELAAPAPAPVPASAPTVMAPPAAATAPVARTVEAAPRDADASDAVDVIDPELFEIFADEGKDLLPALAEQLRLWANDMNNMSAGVVVMRALHTFKGGARLAGAMRMGEKAHRLETLVEQVIARGHLEAKQLAEIESGVDVLSEDFARLLSGEPSPEEAEALAASLVPGGSNPAELMAAVAPLEGAVSAVAPQFVAPAARVSDLAVEMATGQDAHVDWSRLSNAPASVTAQANRQAETMAPGTVRVRAPLLDRMVNHAGEVGIARARIQLDMHQMQSSLRDLTDNLERLRRQLRDLEIQAESQMTSRIEAARHSHQTFDPLEMDRFTRTQELTRMLAESVNDVGTVQRGLVQTLQDAEDQLVHQMRLTRDLQDDLLRARMVEFDTVSDRLYRVVRQSAKESGKLVRLNLVGGSLELDRAVLERMAPPFEHLLRNAVVHGIEAPEVRQARGKEATGTIEISLHQMGNEVLLEVRDDGRGLDLARIAAKARAAGLLAEGTQPSESELAGMIFRSGFTTATQVTELAGRGVGMDVVRAEVTAMGGRIETSTAQGQGTVFKLVLPLTTAVNQVVVLNCGDVGVAVPATLIELIRRVPAADIEQAYRTGTLRHGDQDIAFFWLGSLLQDKLLGVVEGRTGQVVIVRSASQYVALHVSQVQGNQEVVVKNLGVQLSRLPGLAGMSLLPSGGTVLIYNPVALAAVYGQEVRRRLVDLFAPVAADAVAKPVEAVVEAPREPLVMVVDDSLTVRRITQRLLVREGYRVVLAKDGLDALEKLAAGEKPGVMLCDIEMPRMDGFDLVRNVRGDPELADIPVVMITSRIAQKHREHADELGVNHYLGKPYSEDTLLRLVREYSEESARRRGQPVTLPA